MDMSTPTFPTVQTYYEDLNGRIACTSHLGYEAETKLANTPNATVINTSLTKWYRMSGDEVQEFRTAVGIAADRTLCESCRFEHR
jgi:hypothetical protein